MKRFYCTTCKKVKRVRRLPILSASSYHHVYGSVEKVVNERPIDRLGRCDFHHSTHSRNRLNNRLRVMKTVKVKGGSK